MQAVCVSFYFDGFMHSGFAAWFSPRTGEFHSQLRADAADLSVTNIKITKNTVRILNEDLCAIDTQPKAPIAMLLISVGAYWPGQ